MPQHQLRPWLMPAGVGGPGEGKRWLDPRSPPDASMNVGR